jgi:hypothetical protein
MWVKIDDRFFHNPKIRRAGKDGRELYLAGLTYVNSELTDGFIHKDDVAYIASWAEVTAVQETVARLVELRLWEVTEYGYIIHDYHDYNPTRAEALATKQARAEAGSIGGQHTQASKRQANPQANARANARAKINPEPEPDPEPYEDVRTCDSATVSPEDEDLPATLSPTMAQKLMILGDMSISASQGYPIAERNSLANLMAWRDYLPSMTGVRSPLAVAIARMKEGVKPPPNGHGPPGKPPPRAISGLSEADLEVQRELQRAKAQRTTSGPAPPA